MSVTIAKCSVGQAESYFESELASSKVNYYTEQDKQVGDWTGKAVEKLGVAGKIEKTDFVKLVKGENPVTGEQMRRRIQPKPQFVNGEWRTAQEIGTHDAVVSAPKSVSIAALIGGDERVIEAHRKAVNEAVKILESEVRANLGAGKTQKTGNAVIAQFHHDTARPDWKNGLVAPQLHTHCVVMNITRTAEGKWKPIDSREMYKSQAFAKSVYYSKLAENLQQIGYKIEIDEKTNAPEISGISKEYRDACSPRRAEILEQSNGDTANKNHRDAGKFNRRGKVIDRETVKGQHREIEESFNGAAIKAVEEARRNEPETTYKISPEQLKGAYEKNAKEAVGFALEKLSEREAVFDIREVLKEANIRGIGKTTVEEVKSEFESRQAVKQVETVILGDGKQVVYLGVDAEKEKQLPQHLERLKPEKSLSEELQEILNTHDEASEPDKIGTNARKKINDSQKNWAHLSDEQREAVTKIAIAPAGVMTLEGRAGVGKTTTLKFVSTIAEATNYEVLGLAPTTSATAELEAAGIKAATLQKLLQGGEKRAADEQKRFFIVDESSFVSSRQMDKFLREAVKTSDRVLFVGDTRQHEGVEAGRPFARIQENKLADGVKIETIRRQRKESDRETVKKLSQGQIVEAIEEMRERGQIQEIKGLSERHLAIVKEFTKEPEKTLVVAPRNTDRQQINRQIHEELKRNRQIGDENKTIRVLRARNELSGAERKVAGKYEPGDIVQYSRGSREHGIMGGSQTKVIKIDRENNLLTVETAAGKTATYDPKRLSGVSVFKEEEIEVCAGERLQARAAINPGKGRGAAKIANGEMLTIEQIKGDKIHLATQTGKALTIDANEAVVLDYGYAATSHSAQGKTIDRVLIHADTQESEKLLNERMAYVAVSRARDEIKIYTDDAQKLPGKLARKTQKTEIADVFPKPPVQETEKTRVKSDERQQQSGRAKRVGRVEGIGNGNERNDGRNIGVVESNGEQAARTRSGISDVQNGIDSEHKQLHLSDKREFSEVKTRKSDVQERAKSRISDARKGNQRFSFDELKKSLDAAREGNEEIKRSFDAGRDNKTEKRSGESETSNRANSVSDGKDKIGGSERGTRNTKGQANHVLGNHGNITDGDRSNMQQYNKLAVDEPLGANFRRIQELTDAQAKQAIYAEETTNLLNVHWGGVFNEDTKEDMRANLETWMPQDLHDFYNEIRETDWRTAVKDSSNLVEDCWINDKKAFEIPDLDSDKAALNHYYQLGEFCRETVADAVRQTENHELGGSFSADLQKQFEASAGSNPTTMQLESISTKTNSLGIEPPVFESALEATAYAVQSTEPKKLAEQIKPIERTFEAKQEAKQNEIIRQEPSRGMRM